MTKDEALKQALEALENMSAALREDDVLGSDIELMLNAAAAIRVALAQPERPWAGLDHDELIERANQEECASVFSKGAIWGAARLREKNA